MRRYRRYDTPTGPKTSSQGWKYSATQKLAFPIRLSLDFVIFNPASRTSPKSTKTRKMPCCGSIKKKYKNLKVRKIYIHSLTLTIVSGKSTMVGLNLFNPSVPYKSICVGARCRQIGEFRPLRRDFTRLKDRKMSWIVSKGRSAGFLSYIGAGTSV